MILQKWFISFPKVNSFLCLFSERQGRGSEISQSQSLVDIINLFSSRHRSVPYMFVYSTAIQGHNVNVRVRVQPLHCAGYITVLRGMSRRGHCGLHHRVRHCKDKMLSHCKVCWLARTPFLSHAVLFSTTVLFFFVLI